MVIGILIALQVNNWNEARKDRLEEKDILTALEKQFASTSSGLEHYAEMYRVYFEK